MTSTKKWQFWIDRGGTFTDIVACDPQGVISTHKLLSENPHQYKDAALQGIRDVLSISADQPIPNGVIQVVRMGTTVATNALLEHTGEPLLLLVTTGFKDALRIAYQQRPDLFALDIELPEMLYERVEEVTERVMANGEVSTRLDESAARQTLQVAWDDGLRAVSIVFMHGYQYPQHELRIAEIAEQIGFTQISTSYQTSPMIRYISRGDTTVVDAYLSPVLRRYVEQVATELPGTPLLFMQSNGGLTQAEHFQGKDAILSGPAGGVVGMVKTAEKAGYHRLIGFDMGGTSTDVCHYLGGAEQSTYERTLETQIAGVRISSPMMRVHTVAAGGGSVLHFDKSRYRVGPDSAGAVPGPAAYRAGGPLTVTDCNVLLGKLQPAFFPGLFGTNADQVLDIDTVKLQFNELAKECGQSCEQLAEGFLTIAVENMANAIKKISVQRGYDITDYTLCSFGGAGGQHACAVADALGMKRVFLHEYSGVLSAYGMGLADIRKISRRSLDVPLNTQNYSVVEDTIDELAIQLEQTMRAQFDSHSERLLQDQQINFQKSLHCKYQGSDSSLTISYEDSQYQSKSLDILQQKFKDVHRQQFGFHDANKTIVVASIEVEAIVSDENSVGDLVSNIDASVDLAILPVTTQPVYLQGKWHQVPFYERTLMPLDTLIKGPAVILESTGTIVVDPGWCAELQTSSNQGSHILLRRYLTYGQQYVSGNGQTETVADPVRLEVFNNLFMSVAEQMGFVLEKTAVSVNIKERLDFSCAIFDPHGDLVANAPHMPVHLGSMSESIKTVIRDSQRNGINPGDAFVLNDPYHGGTHLPDITVIRPVFLSDMRDDDKSSDSDKIIFYVASRGHHADIGGITPGSIPPDSRSVEDEGVLINNFKWVKAGVVQEDALNGLLTSGDYPVRNLDYNLADLKAQLAACEKGTVELNKIIRQYGLALVQAYMVHIQDNAEESVRRVISTLKNGEFCYAMDDGSQIKVKISVNVETRTACIDFAGTSEEHKGNLNAPTAITRAAVLYVFRTLVKDNIPLNEGCLKPLQIIIPKDCMLNPGYPAAVVAGNVETSQYIVDTLYGALALMGASQGTMNNVTWGNAHYQYYETLCGGAGATANQDGADAVHSHMTNSRLTDPEVLEQRFPVMLEEFSIRENSGGRGRHKGGNGVVRKTKFLQPMRVNVLSGHRLVAPYGMQGGEAGKTGENSLCSEVSTVEKPVDISLSYKDQITVKKGDVLIIKTPGGGGYGQAD